MANNGITPDQFSILLSGLKATYPSKWFIPTEEAANVWYRMLKDIPYEALNTAVYSWIETSPKEPTIADIRAEAMRYSSNQDPDLNLNEQEAWSIVNKAIQRSGWHAEEEFDKLPPLLKRAVASASNLHEWSQSVGDGSQSVAMSQFLRNFRIEQKRAKEEALLSPAVQKRLQIAMEVAKGKRIETKKQEPEEAWAKEAFERSGERNLEDGSTMPEETKQKYDELMRKWA